MRSNIIIVGNGILSLTTALKLKTDSDDFNVKIIAPFSRIGSASLAAPAMLNCYAELVRGGLDTEIDKVKFKISRLAGKAWQSFFTELSDIDVPKPIIGRGTYLINNATTDKYDDENFDAIINYLEEYNEPYEFISPNLIPGYMPSSRERAIRSIFLKEEGFVNSESVIKYLDDLLRKMGVHFIDASVTQLKEKNGIITGVILDSGEVVSADKYILAPGASFSKIIESSNLTVEFPKVFYGSGVALEVKPRDYAHTNCIRTPNRGLACGIYTAPRNEGTIVVGASNYVADYPLEHGALTSIESLLKSAMEQINHSFYNAGLVNIRVGWRPTSEDTYPLIGLVNGISNLIVATGTKRDGFHMSPIISEYIFSLCSGEYYEHAGLFSYFVPNRSLIRSYTREKAIKETVDHYISAMFQHDFVPPKSDMLEDYKAKLQEEISFVHDKIGAFEWGIPPELYSLYKGGYLSCGCV